MLILAVLPEHGELAGSIIQKHGGLVSASACEYTLTPLEFTLIEALCGVWLWAAAHAREVEWARRKFNKRKR